MKVISSPGYINWDIVEGKIEMREESGAQSEKSPATSAIWMARPTR